MHITVKQRKERIAHLQNSIDKLTDSLLYIEPLSKEAVKIQSDIEIYMKSLKGLEAIMATEKLKLPPAVNTLGVYYEQSRNTK